MDAFADLSQAYFRRIYHVYDAAGADRDKDGCRTRFSRGAHPTSHHYTISDTTISATITFGWAQEAVCVIFSMACCHE
jgi:hypothetical protein